MGITKINLPNIEIQEKTASFHIQKGVLSNNRSEIKDQTRV